jgi:ATP-dependent DNA ligase
MTAALRSRRPHRYAARRHRGRPRRCTPTRPAVAAACITPTGRATGPGHDDGVVTRDRPGRYALKVCATYDSAPAAAHTVLMASSRMQLPVPLALTRPTDTLIPVAGPALRYEPKWDGYRVLVADGRMWSRRGTDLTPYFPDLAPVLKATLPGGTVVDGELVAWDAEAGRLDFAGLQARLTAGKKRAAAVADRPAQLVCFDLLAHDGVDLRPRPLVDRRQQLEAVLSGLRSPIVLCEQTGDQEVAAEWMQTLSVAGIEGVVIKDAQQPYPVRDGQRIWWKLKSRRTLDMVAIGIVGDPKQPTSLVLAMPGGGELATAGSTTVLSKAVALTVAPLLELTGETFERRLAWGDSDPVLVQQIRPLVVEVSADAAVDAGVLRHGARLLRARPDLEPTDLIDR